MHSGADPEDPAEIAILAANDHGFDHGADEERRSARRRAPL
jgi:hypothetical protein